jgi:hypothetical protein
MTDDERHFFLRRASDSPPSYRVKYHGVEVGSISETSNHVSKVTYWRWGVDMMPLMEHGGRPPSGQALTRADAQAAFREAFLAVPMLSDPLPASLFLSAADIYRLGRSRGVTIRSSVDCLIAAIAIHNKVPVWHRDRDFTAIARYTSLRAMSRCIS